MCLCEKNEEFYLVHCVILVSKRFGHYVTEIASTHSTLNATFMILSIKPYRAAFLQMINFTCWKKLKLRVKNSITQAHSSQMVEAIRNSQIPVVN